MKYVNYVLSAIEETNNKPFYTSRKKNEVSISVHVRKQFVERFFALTNVVLEPEQIDFAITNLFNSSTRIGKNNPIYVKRNKLHGGSSLYFQNQHFVFVVEDKVIVTAEVVTDRELN